MRVCLLVAGALVASPLWAANGYFLHGFSAPQRAMAGAGTALAGEAAQLPVNPAGIVGVGSQWSLDLNVIHAINEAQVSPSRGGPGLLTIEAGTIRSAAEDFQLPFAAYAAAIDSRSAWAVSFNGGGLKSLYTAGQSRVAQGIPGLDTRCRGVFAGGRAISPDLDPAGLCGDGDGVSSGELVLLYFRAGYARRFGDALSLGVSPILVVESFKARGLSAFDDYSVAPGHVTDRGHPKSPSLGVGGRIGALWTPLENLTLGASWQSKIAVGRFDSYEGVILDGGRIDSPEMWNAGIAVRPARRHLLAADFERVEFSDIPVLGRRFNAPAFAERCLLPRLLLGATPTSSCLGGDQGPGFGWTDTRSYKLGYRYSPTPELAFGLGYAWTRRAVHGDQALFNILAPAVTNDHYSGGVSWRVRPGLTLNIAALYAPRRGVTGRNPLSHIDAAALVPGPADPSAGALFGTDPLDQEVRIAAEVVELIFGVEIGF